LSTFALNLLATSETVFGQLFLRFRLLFSRLAPFIPRSFELTPGRSAFLRLPGGCDLFLQSLSPAGRFPSGTPDNIPNLRPSPAAAFRSIFTASRHDISPSNLS
jgi:hypothetical protein